MLLAVLLARPCFAADAPPNVVIILCDDLGYGDLACYGHPHIRTPHLDQLAAEGVRLTDCYAAAPVCSSSRAGLLTGRNPNRSGVYDWIPGGSVVHLALNEPTIPQHLRLAGYQTAMVGKWHLNGLFNDPAHPQPGDYGFQHWMATQNNASPSHRQPDNFVRNGRPVGKMEGFSCQMVAEEACRWMRQAATGDAPFYLHVCFHEPHEPVESPAAIVESYSGVAKNHDQAQYFANVTNMDAAVGKIIGQLDALELSEETLVIFTSDNGPETLNRYPNADRSYGSPGPLREMKLHLYEGGVRVPGILRWSGKLPGGTTDSTPVSGVDWLPTLCELAEQPIESKKTLDGQSLVDWLHGDPLVREKPLHWMYYRGLTEPKFALRDGRWKILASWTKPDGGVWADGERLPGGNVNPESVAVIKQAELTRFQLYDLQNDIGETRDVADKHPQVLERLKNHSLEIFDEVVAEGPDWFDSSPAR